VQLLSSEITGFKKKNFSNFDKKSF
jgi:hypothetical protein